MKSTEESIALAKLIAADVKNAGGCAYYVGGFVRDRIMGESADSADIDIEVHGLYPDKLCEIIDRHAKRVTVGESFGIYSVYDSQIDVAMPRTERATGRGHRDFETFVDPFIGTEAAASRRDFTVNAIMENVLTGEITDHFGGCADIEHKILRHVNDASFPEDPLRVLRGAQFASRFGFAVAPETALLMKNIPLDTLSCERIDGELRKALLRSEKPSVFFGVLRDTDQLGYWFPEVQALIGVMQDPLFHKEGDVWTHTMMVLDEAAKRRSKASDPYAFMLSALCHDFGKPATTEYINGRIHSYGHEFKGVGIAAEFLRRLTNDKKITKYVLNMVQYHMKPNTMAAHGSAVKATNRMFDESADPEGLIQLAVADSLGMTFDRKYYPSEDFLEERLDIYRETMAKPYVTGQDLIAAGLVPGETFREVLEYSHKLRLAGIEKESALKQSVAFADKLKKNK